MEESGGEFFLALPDNSYLSHSTGGNLNAASRQALMQKLARIEPAPVAPQPVARPHIPSAMQSKSVLLNNMFDPEEYAHFSGRMNCPHSCLYFFHRETERDWDKELAEEVAGECGDKYGPVLGIKVEKETQVCRFLPLQPIVFTDDRLSRAKFTSNSTPSNQPKMPFKVSMVAILAEGASQLLSSLMPCFRPTSNRRQHRQSNPWPIRSTKSL